MVIKTIFKQIAHYAKKILANKYLIVLCIGGAWLTFMDDNSITSYLQYDLKIRELTREINTHKKGIAECERKMDEMKTDMESLEKYAREQYYMKRSNEDIFIIK